jgi:hypothetical protein
MSPIFMTASDMHPIVYGQNVQTVLFVGILIALWAIYREVRKIAAKGEKK